MAVIATRQANGSFADQVFDEVVGSTRKWFTLSGNLLDGTYHPIPADGSEQVGFIGAYAADAYGSVLRPVVALDGTFGVTIPNHNDITALGPYTQKVVEAVFETAADITTRQVIWEQGGAARGLSIYIDQGYIYVNGWNLEDDDGGLTTPWGPKYVAAPISPNTRYHVTLVFDQPGNLIRGLLNGVEFGQVSGVGKLFAHTDGIGIGFVSGTTYFHDTQTAGPAYSYAKIFEVRHWNNIIRSDLEIQRDMNKPLTGIEPGLVGYWTMDEGSSGTVYDKTVNANHGTLQTVAWTTVQAPSTARWKLDTPRPAHKLRVHGDTQRNIYPVDFDVQLYDANANKLLERQVRGNTLVQWSETLLQTYDFVVMDITVYKVSGPPVVLTEASNEFLIVRSDTLLPKTIETILLLALYSQDALLPKVAEVQDITASFTKTDTLLSKTAEGSFFTWYEFRRTDTLLPKTTEATLGITASFTKQDTLLLKVLEAKSITAYLTKVDTMVLYPYVEIDQITVYLTRPDVLLPALSVLSTPTNVHTRMDDDARTVYGRVKITYTDPFMDPDMTVTASSIGRYTYPEQVADNVVEPKYKWFSLHDSKLDGTYHPMPSNKEHSVGWWSATLSDASGSFATPSVLTVEFAQTRPIYELMVAGDALLGNYPVDFTVELYDISNTLLHTESVIGNNTPIWYKDIADVVGVKKMVLTINKISKPYQPAKVVEFYTLVVETYENDAIESIQLLEELEYPGATVVLGAVSSNEIDITLNNIDGRFNLGNADSPLDGLLKTNRKVQAWLGVEIVPGEIEWHPLGVFWTVFWKIPDQSVWVYLTARDRLELLRQTDFTTSVVYQNYTMYQLAELILQDAGLNVNDYYIDEALQTIVIPYAWFDRMSHRDALQRLAEAGIVQVYCDRQGSVRVERVQPTPTRIYAFDDDKNLFGKDFPLVWGQVANYIEVAAVEWAPGELSTVCESTEVIDVPAGTDVEATYAFSSVPAVDVQAPAITAGPNIQVYSYTVYAWGIKVVFRNVGASVEQVTQITVTGRPLEQKGSALAVAKDDTSIRDLGKIKATIQHDFIQTRAYAQALADALLALCKNSRQDITMDTRGNIALNLGDRVTAPGHLQNVVYEYIVKRQEIKWAGSLEATVEGQRIE